MLKLIGNRAVSRGLQIHRGAVCLYHQGTAQAVPKDVHVVDLRSDVLTQPTPEMRKLIAEAELADDVFGECSVTNALQERVAKLFGKEAALFVPSGTMGNLISVLAHCPERGREVLLGDKSHIFLWEQGGISQLGGLHSNTIPNFADGTFSVEEIDKRVRPTNDVHYPLTGLICVENTQNYCGGSVVPLDWLKQVKERANEHKLPVHMDGARVMNAAVALNVTVKEILKDVDTVNMCFSKGLGAPVGSVIAGPPQFIERAKRLRKVMGGGWRQPGLLAAAANYCLDHAEETLRKDHHHAQMLAKALNEHGQGVISISPEKVHTNILMIEITKPGLTAEQFTQRLAQVKDDEKTFTGGQAISVKVRPARLSNTRIRMYTHKTVNTHDIALAIKKWLLVTEKEETDLKKAVQVKSLPFGTSLTRLVLHWNINAEDVQAAVDKCMYVIDELK